MEKITKLFSTFFLIACLISPLKTYPCGGSAYEVIDSPLLPLNNYLSDTLIIAPDYFSYSTRKEYVFLYPFYKGSPVSFYDLWVNLYRTYWETMDEAPLAKEEITLTPFKKLIDSENFDQAEIEAKAQIEKIISLPLVKANENKEELKQLVEYVDLKSALTNTDPDVLKAYFINHTLPAVPYGWVSRCWSTIKTWFGFKTALIPDLLKNAQEIRLAGPDAALNLIQKYPSTPRLASLEFTALKNAMKTQIPDGYRDEIQNQVTAKTWQTLENQHTQWIEKYPAHPLAVLAKLSLVHLYYLKGDIQKSWDILLDIYPHHLPRVLGEMRFLIYQGHIPPPINDPRIDAQLLSSFVPFTHFTAEEWSKTWEIAEQNLNQPWGLNMEQRLLAKLAEEPLSALPRAFPQNDNKNGLWGLLKAINLLKVGEWEKAEKQLKVIETQDEHDLPLIGRLKARIDLKNGKLVNAVLNDGLDADSAKYLVRVLANDQELDEIIKINAGSTMGQEALLTKAIHLSAKGQWEQADWDKAKTLEADKSPPGLLKWARYLVENDKMLFYPEDREWYIALSSRYSELENTSDPSPFPWSAQEEKEKIKNHLLYSSELYLALKAYTTWLKQASPDDAEFKTVVKEADKTYRHLIDYANWSASLWQNFLENSEQAQIIRIAGKKLKH
ncbi:hypothetical protein K1X76_08590 [bacterium]|nr:hypothetical protein [bacterium]